jgi:hypothetical protein
MLRAPLFEKNRLDVNETGEAMVRKRPDMSQKEEREEEAD